MTTIIPTAAPTPLFIPMSDFRKYGLPGRTKAYDLAKNGLLDLRDLGGRTGVTLAEAVRYVGTAAPKTVGNKRNTSPGVAASLRSRGARP